MIPFKNMNYFPILSTGMCAYSVFALRKSEASALLCQRNWIRPTHRSIWSMLRLFSFRTWYHYTKQGFLSQSYVHFKHDFFLSHSQITFFMFFDLTRANASAFQNETDFFKALLTLVFLSFISPEKKSRFIVFFWWGKKPFCSNRSLSGPPPIIFEHNKIVLLFISQYRCFLTKYICRLSHANFLIPSNGMTNFTLNEIGRKNWTESRYESFCSVSFTSLAIVIRSLVPSAPFFFFYFKHSKLKRRQRIFCIGPGKNGWNPSCRLL